MLLITHFELGKLRPGEDRPSEGTAQTWTSKPKRSIQTYYSSRGGNPLHSSCWGSVCVPRTLLSKIICSALCIAKGLKLTSFITGSLGFLLDWGIQKKEDPSTTPWHRDASWAPHQFHPTGFCSSKPQALLALSLLQDDCVCQLGCKLRAVQPRGVCCRGKWNISRDRHHYCHTSETRHHDLSPRRPSLS